MPRKLAEGARLIPGISSRRIISEGHLGRASSDLPGMLGSSGYSGASGGHGDAGKSGNSSNFGASARMLTPIFIVFRGCIARPTRLAAREAEPSFLLAGAAL